jgi:hypothetical protein
MASASGASVLRVASATGRPAVDVTRRTGGDHLADGTLCCVCDRSSGGRHHPSNQRRLVAAPNASSEYPQSIGRNVMRRDSTPLYMVSTTEKDGATWYRCEECGLMFDAESDARTHETNCDSDDDSPSYLQ